MAELFDLNGGVETTSLDGEYGFYLVATDGIGTPTNSGFVTLQTLADWIMINQSAVPAGVPQSIVHLKLSANEAVANITNIVIPWDAAHENTTGGELGWSIGAPTRITVGAGVSRVRITAQVRWDAGAGNNYLTVLKNGSIFHGYARQVSSNSTVNPSGTLVCDVAVTLGDYLELNAYQDSGSSKNIITGESTWFKVEVTERT